MALHVRDQMTKHAHGVGKPLASASAALHIDDAIAENPETKQVTDDEPRGSSMFSGSAIVWL